MRRLVGLALGGWSWSYMGNRQLVANVQADLAQAAKVQENRIDLQSRFEALQILQDRIEQALAETMDDRALLPMAIDKATFTEASKPLFEFLDQLHPNLWREGKQFPQSQAQVTQMLADGELLMGLTFNPNEPANLANTIAALKLRYVVITSVDRDDLRDGGAGHFVDCIRKTRALSPHTQIEVLVPDFRGRDDRALEILKAAPPDVMNHNLETIPRLYKEARPGSDYQFSLNLLKQFKAFAPDVPTKSGLMVGLGETDEEILQAMRDMRAHDIDMLTLGQYLAPSGHHLPVRRYVHPDTFRMFEAEALKMGFTHAAVGAMVRSSYHADQQAHAAGVADTL